MSYFLCGDDWNAFQFCGVVTSLPLQIRKFTVMEKKSFLEVEELSDVGQAREHARRVTPRHAVETFLVPMVDFDGFDSHLYLRAGGSKSSLGLGSWTALQWRPKKKDGE